MSILLVTSAKRPHGHNRIVVPDYGRAYAAALPIARFELLENTGHLPQLETPEQLMRAIWDCGDSDFSD